MRAGVFRGKPIAMWLAHHADGFTLVRCDGDTSDEDDHWRYARMMIIGVDHSFDEFGDMDSITVIGGGQIWPCVPPEVDVEHHLAVLCELAKEGP